MHSRRSALRKNHAKSQDTSDGFTRRWLFLQFNRKVPAHLKVTDIAEEVLANEREAIAAWAAQAVKGMRDYTIPASSAALVETLANDLNPVRCFLTQPDQVKLKAPGYVTEAALYDRFWKFAALAEGGRPPAMKAFRKMLEGLRTELGFSIDTVRDGRTGMPMVAVRGVELA
jgi:putative DNA primase/helicase